MTPATWRHKGGLASWSYDLTAPPPDRRRWLTETALTVTELLDGFAVPTEAWLTTEAQGDLADPLALPPQAAGTALREALDRYDDLVAVRFTLALLLALEPGDAPHPLPDSATLLLELDADEGGRPYLHIHLAVHVDIYVERTHAEDRDNAVLAHENGPRLTAFLRALQTRLGATVSDVAAISYPEQITADGFRLS